MLILSVDPLPYNGLLETLLGRSALHGEDPGHFVPELGLGLGLGLGRQPGLLRIKPARQKKKKNSTYSNSDATPEAFKTTLCIERLHSVYNNKRHLKAETGNLRKRGEHIIGDL